MIGTSDFHVHSYVSYDTDDACTPGAIAQIAAACGLKEVGLTDHLQIRSEGAPGFSRLIDDPREHDELGELLRSETFPVRMLFGWEVDYFDGSAYSFDPASDVRRLDYVLLGHHYFNLPGNASHQDTADYLIRIYEDMANEPYADIIAHPFYVPGGAERHGGALSCIQDEVFYEFFSTMAANGKAAEITTFQFLPAYRDTEQSMRMYRIALETGVRFVLDSDSHHLSETADGLRCLPLLDRLGFSEDRFLDYEGLMEMARTAGRRTR